MIHLNLKSKTEEMLAGILFILPAFAGIIFFAIIPIIEGVYYSFTDWQASIQTANFIGFGNYIKALSDEIYLMSLRNTFLLSFFGTVLCLLLGFASANLLFSMKKSFSDAGKVILFIPYLLSFAAVGVLFSFVFGSSNMGLLNKILSIFGMEPFPWFGSNITALPAVIAVYAWKDYGLFLLLYLAGLNMIPVSRLEAASIDGATGWQIVKYIKIPGVKPITQLLIILEVINLMLAFTIVMFLTPDGGPEKWTETVCSWFYKQSFTFWNFGYGSCLAVTIAVIVMVITLLVRKVIKIEEVG